jgi:hypothetical protein
MRRLGPTPFFPDLLFHPSTGWWIMIPVCMKSTRARRTAFFQRLHQNSWAGVGTALTRCNRAVDHRLWSETANIGRRRFPEHISFVR